MILDTPWPSDPDSLDAQIGQDPHVARQIRTEWRTQESDRGTGKRATCDFAFHAVTLSVPSVSVSCVSKRKEHRGRTQ
jgi:hypothetical protein